jgi:hypothetical protein
MSAIFLTAEQARKYNEEIDRLAVAFERTRDPTVLHKFLPAAFVDQTIQVCFRNGIVGECAHAGKSLGQTGAY